MGIEISNVNDDFSDTGGGVNVSHCAWGSQQEIKARPGLVFKMSAELLTYSASWTLLLYLSTSSSSTDVSLHGMLRPEFHTQDAMTLLVLACLIAALCSASWSSSAFLSCQIHPSCHVTHAPATLHLFCRHMYLSSKWR